MATSAKRLKLSLRKTNPQLELNKNNVSTAHVATSSSRDNLEQNQILHPTNEFTVSSSLRKKLIECLPVLPNCNDFSGFPEVSADDEMSKSNSKVSVSLPCPNETKNDRFKEKCTTSDLDSTSTNIPNNNNVIRPKSSLSSPLTNAQISSSQGKHQTKNPYIEQCPLCPLIFPYDWSQQKINSHVSTHLDEEDFD